VIPIHLNELAPDAFRSSFPGITYQLGNMISSPSAQLVNAISEVTFVAGVGGKGRVPAYGPVMGIATAIIAMGILFTTCIGPEKRGKVFASHVAGAEDQSGKDAESAVAVEIEAKTIGETDAGAAEKKQEV
jgi:hypothetical protein